MNVSFRDERSEVEESRCVIFPGSFTFVQDDGKTHKILRNAQNDDRSSLAPLDKEGILEFFG